ncbi:hypothetical protein [Rhodococcus erythropolis]|uniref:hypothetical protein n=1 Tax=Rhodococcus erythropolis TaxID=1833 RepID=UPI00366E6130
MTAPDPGLTDLIAAHLVETVTPDGDCGVFILDCTCGAEVRFTQADLNAAPVDSTAGALHYMLREHVSVELEQHTNGRMAELEAELAEVTDKWGLISHHYRKAQATIDRVRDALTIGPLHRLDFPKYKDPYAIDRHVIRAALKGVDDADQTQES